MATTSSAQLNTGGTVQVLNDDNLLTHVVAKGAETEPLAAAYEVLNLIN